MLQLVGDGVADRKTHWLIRSSTSSNVQRPVVACADGRRKPCSTSMSLRLRSPIELAVQLRHGDVALVDDEQEVVGEVVEQGERRLAGLRPSMCIE